MSSTPPALPKGDRKKGSKFDSPGGSGAKNGDVVIQRVVREVAGGTSYPVLTKTNYSDWVWLMKVKLKAHQLWRAIVVGDVDPHDDMMALNALCSAMPSELATVISDKDTAKEVWDAIKTMRVGSCCMNSSLPHSRMARWWKTTRCT